MHSPEIPTETDAVQTQKDSKLVTWIRCFHCGVEQTVIGPTSHPTFERPGWQVDLRELYRPGGHHYCERHARQAWAAYCAEIDDCWACLSGSPLYLDAPSGLDEETIAHRLGQAGVLCRGGFEIAAVEPAAEDHYHDLVGDFEFRL